MGDQNVIYAVTVAWNGRKLVLFVMQGIMGIVSISLLIKRINSIFYGP